MSETTDLLIAAIICLTIIQCLAITKGINGVVLTLIVGSICAIAANQAKAIKIPPIKFK